MPCVARGISTSGFLVMPSLSNFLVKGAGIVKLKGLPPCFTLLHPSPAVTPNGPWTPGGFKPVPKVSTLNGS